VGFRVLPLLLVGTKLTKIPCKLPKKNPARDQNNCRIYFPVVHSIGFSRSRTRERERERKSEREREGASELERERERERDRDRDRDRERERER